MSEKDLSTLVDPPKNVSSQAHVGSLDAYHKEYQKSIEDPDSFWSNIASDFHWFKKWNQVRSYNYNMDDAPIDIKWFSGAKTNVCYNCVDRHLDQRPDKTAVIWEGNEPGEDQTLSYRELH